MGTSTSDCQAIATGYGLIEGPVWHRSRGLLFSDVQFGGVYALATDGEISLVLPHRKGIGGMALHVDDDGLVVSGRNIAFKPFNENPTQVLLDRDEAAGLVGFNDITTDSAGRIYAGGLALNPLAANSAPTPTENLYLIDTDGVVRTVAQDVRLTNGLGFSPDGKTLYHSDSARRGVYCYSVAADGTLGRKELFAETQRGAPDGLAVSTDGAVWVALAAGGKGVAVYSENGSEQDFIEIPEPMCTSVCFGGDDLGDLYIVSGSDGSPTDRAGSVYRYRTSVTGVPVAAATVRLA